MCKDSSSDWVPLLVPDMPHPKVLMPWLERMHNSRCYTNFGPLVNELEKVFAKKFNVENNNVTTVANATLGLELVLKALKLPKNSRILIPSFTFVATASAVLRSGHHPVFADVDAASWLLTPEIAKEIIFKNQVDAVIAVATFGMPHNMQEWQKFEEENKIPVVIDAAAAYGSQWLNGFSGTLVFSLHATKSLPAGEGGLVVSNRPGLAEEVRGLSNFGINLNKTIGDIYGQGTNAKMSEYHAAVCLASLYSWENKAEKRRNLYREMIERISEASKNAFSWQQSDLRLMAPTILCGKLPSFEVRRNLESACKQARITTRRWYQPLVSDLRSLNGEYLAMDIPVAKGLECGAIGFPFFINISESHKDRIFKIIKDMF